MPLFFYKYFQRTVLYRQTKMAVFGKFDSRGFEGGATFTIGNDDDGNPRRVTMAGNTAAKTFLEDDLADDDNYVDVGDILVIDGDPYIVRGVRSGTVLDLYTDAPAGAVTTIVRRTAPKAVADAVLAPIDSRVERQILYISLAEAQIEDNRSRGLKIPGWHVFETYVNGQGDTINRAECIAAVKNNQGTSEGDLDLASGVASDVEQNIVLFPTWDGIGNPVPADANDTIIYDVAVQTLDIAVDANAIVNLADPEFVNTGTLTFQWQRQKTSNGRWANVTDTTDGGGIFQNMLAGAPVLDIVAPADTSLDGYEFRVKVTNDEGATEVVSVDLKLSVIDTTP